MKKSLLVVFCLFNISLVLHSHEVKEVNFNTRIMQSHLVVEGEVIEKRSFWDTQHRNIYTANKIKVYKIFKGNLSSSFIEIITPGGTVDFEREVVEPSLSLSVNETGIFMLKNNTVSGLGISSIPQYQPYASVQGFVKYNLSENKATTPFNNFNTIDVELYNSIRNLTLENYTQIAPFSLTQKAASGNKAVPTITNFSPTTITAGTGTQLTINGTNFGATAGTVSFSDANDGGASFFDALPHQIISWNTNQIVVEVPDRAGTGIIRVTNTDPNSVNSAATLTISYALLNVESDNINPGTDIAYPTQHINDNENGGYTWQFFTDFNNNAAAKAAFLRALDSWRCTATSVNWSVGPVSTIDAAASDGVNIVRFDNGAELPAGVLGRCTSRYSACSAGGGTTLNWYVTELDIVFNDNFTWNFDVGNPTNSEYDFESVAVHELGHGHQLGHVIDTDDVMHFSISNGEQLRTPNANNTAGGNNVMNRSTTNSVCGQGLMTSFTCNQAPVTRFSGNQTSTCGNSLNVTFSDESLGIPTSWLWDFGDGGSTSTLQNPTHNYASAGTYTVSLTATNANGSTPLVKTNFITVGGGAPTAGCAVSSTGLGAFGTGIRNFTMANINHSTPNAQTDGGYVDFSCSQIISGIDTGQTVNFSLTVGTTNNEHVKIYIDYNDNGTFEAGEEVYSSPSPGQGTFASNIKISSAATVVTGKVIRLRAVSDFNAINGGCSNVNLGQHEDYGLLINVPSGAVPVANFNSSSTNICKENTVSFTDISTNNPTSWNWSFPGGTPSSSTTQNPTITYNTPGVYQVQLTATNANGSDMETKVNYITVSDCPNIQPFHCNLVVPTTNFQIYSTVVNNATEYEFRLIPQGGGDTVTYLSTRSFRFNFYWFSGWEYNTVYNLSVRAKVNGTFTDYGSSCLVTSPNATVITAPTIQASFCGITLPQENHTIYATTQIHATNYEFRLIPQGGGATINYSSCCSNQLNFARFSGWEYGTTYDVSVRAMVNGTLTDYGASCAITTHSLPLPTIQPFHCNITVPTLNYRIYSKVVNNATEYEFRLVPQGGGSTINYVSTHSFILNFIRFSGWTVNTTYDVSVRAKINGSFTNYGASCPITSPNTPLPKTGPVPIENSNSINFGSIQTNLDLTLYPNPNQGETVDMKLNGLNANSKIIFTDISGKVMLNESLNNTSSSINRTLRFENKLSPGFYMITIVSGNNKVTKKLIVK